MIEIRKALHKHFKSLYPKVYFQQVPDKVDFPYVVYDFQIYNNDESTSTVSLDIDAWDRPKDNDTTEIENLISIVDIDKQIIATEDLTVVFYLESKLAPVDNDPKIKRRRYSYTGYLHERG